RAEPVQGLVGVLHGSSSKHSELRWTGSCQDWRELPPLKRGTYDLDAILAAAENAEFAIPPPPSKSSFNSNPFASSAPSAFRSNFSPSSTPSINNSPYPSSSTEADQEHSPALEKSQPVARKPVVSPAARKRVSTLKSTLSKFSAPKKTDLEPTLAESAELDAEIRTAGTGGSLTLVQDRDDVGNRSYTNHAGTPGNHTVLSVDSEDLSFEDKKSTHRSPGTISSPTLSNGVRSRPLRATPFNRVVSPGPGGSHLEPAALPSRTGSPVNVSSGSMGTGNDIAVYSTPSSSRPTSRPSSRPTSRPASRVSSNGRYHSRQLSSDSLLSFNAMVDKEDPDDEPLNHSGHVSFVVSDPEHLRILEGEIEDPFSPSMSSIDPDTDAYLSSLIQQSSPFGALKTSSRGQSPAFKPRRQRTTEGDESFMYSTDDALSDKEASSKFRSPRSGTRTPSSPLARAVTKGFSRDPDNMIVSAMARTGGQLSLDQILRDSQEGDRETFSSPGSGLMQESTLQISGTELLTQVAADEPIKVVLHSPASQPGSPTPDHNTNGDSQRDSSKALGIDASSTSNFEKRDSTDIEQVEVDIVVQNVNVHDELEFKNDGIVSMDVLNSDYSDLDDADNIHFNQSTTEVLANEEMFLHESLDMPETHAQSFADWMSSSAEISRLDISPPMAIGQQPLPSFGQTLTPVPIMAPPQGISLLSSTSGEVNVLTSSYTPNASSPEATFASPLSTSPNAAKRTTLLEKRSTLIDDLLAKARERTKHKTEASQLLTASVEKEKSMVVSSSTNSSSAETSAPESTVPGSTVPSVTFAAVDEVKVLEQGEDAPQTGDEDASTGDNVITASEKKDGGKEGGLVRRPSGIMLSSRIRDSTNLDAPRYSIREMEDMKKNVRMDLRIEITNEIREEYERSAEQEAAIFQYEIEELKTALEKEKREKAQLKGVLDEFESSLADIAVSTAKEIQTIKEQNRKLTESKEETEEAFVILKTRYDELKNLNSKHVENEGILRKAVDTLKQDFETSESRFESVKAHADAKLVQASQEMEQARMMYDNEIAMLKSQLSRQEMQMRTLEQALEIKNKENEDLILFSEELIAKLS
ncbi:hypothetical protein BGX28_007430, partial [Mortierella sp. GBA30]